MNAIHLQMLKDLNRETILIREKKIKSTPKINVKFFESLKMLSLINIEDTKLFDAEKLINNNLMKKIVCTYFGLGGLFYMAKKRFNFSFKIFLIGYTASLLPVNIYVLYRNSKFNDILWPMRDNYSMKIEYFLETGNILLVNQDFLNEKTPFYSKEIMDIRKSLSDDINLKLKDEKNI